MAAIFKIPFLVKRLFSTLSSTRNAIEHLNNRALVEIKGPDASNFLQGLITNDINHLNNDHEPGSMYTMFLNSKGRILYDSIIYKTEEPDVFWIECDSSASSSLQKYLKIYKLRRKVDILCLKDRQIYVAFNNEQIGQPNGNTFSGNLEESIYMPENTQYNISSNLLFFKDPRVAQLGFRIIAIDNEDVSAKNSIQALFNGNSIIRNKNEYKKLRYTLGIGEGIEDLPVENSFPLECNCDYLHGVSFHKGCYIGQELTARTHHTGVIRKRLMPLFFSKSPTLLPEKNSIIHNNVNLGKLRGVEGNLGLALLRFDQALNFETITVGNGLAHIVKPHWWPVELTKGKLNVNVK